MSPLACPDCDLLLRRPAVPAGGAARCPRCGARLLRRRAHGLERTLALTLAAAILFAVANALPFLAFEMQGLETRTTLGSGVRELWSQGRQLVALLVAVTTIAAPLAEIALVLYVIGPLHLGRRPPGFARAFRWLQHVRTWSMMEVFLIGILVALVKLADMATIVPGLALWAFALLIPVLAAASAALDPALVWSRVELRR